MNNKRKSKFRYFQYARAIHMYIHKFIKTGEEKYRATIIKHCSWYDEETIDSWRDLYNNI